MKCLTVCEPWAFAILHRGKRVENRTWATPYTGPLLIHAGKSKAFLDWQDLAKWPRLYGVQPPKLADLHFGCIVGVVMLEGCARIDRTGQLTRTTNCASWPWLASHRFLEGPVGWVLSHPRVFEQPIPFRGDRGLFDVPDEVVAEQLARVDGC